MIQNMTSNEVAAGTFSRPEMAAHARTGKAMADNNDVLEAIAGVKNLLDVIGTQTGQTELDVREIKSDISQLKTDVGELKTDVRELKADVDRIETKLDRQHVEWISDCIEHLQRHGVATIEATPDAQAAWTAHVADVANASLMPAANSWYMGRNVPGKPQVFMPYLGGVGPYRQKCAEIAAHGYEGFALQ
jgi:septal ring factor EnvC (AmiA/AmiB activator)